MIKRMSALIWLRFKLFTVNKAILFEIISPFIFINTYTVYKTSVHKTVNF